MCYHQIFIIAHINDRYRCLAKAVFFEPWPYGISVPSRCGRLISIFESSSNALAISSELSYAKTLPPSFWEDKESDQESDKEGDDDPAAKIEYPEHPFSYIETCLTVGASWDPMKRLYTEVDEPEQYSQIRLITEDIDGLLRRLEVDTPTREQIVTLWHERLGKLRIKDYWGPDLSKLLECSIEPCSTEDAEFLLEYAMKGVQSEGS